MNPIPNIPKNPNIYICKNCQYKTFNKKDYKKHLSTRKHQNLINPNNTYLENPIKIHKCLCGKVFFIKHFILTIISITKKNVFIGIFEDENTIIADNPNITSNSSEVLFT